MQCPILPPSWLGAVLFLLVSDGRGSGGGGGGGEGGQSGCRNCALDKEKKDV